MLIVIYLDVLDLDMLMSLILILILKNNLKCKLKSF